MSKSFGLILFLQFSLFSNEVQRSEWLIIHTVVSRIFYKNSPLQEHMREGEHIINSHVCHRIVSSYIVNKFFIINQNCACRTLIFILFSRYSKSQLLLCVNFEVPSVWLQNLKIGSLKGVTKVLSCSNS